ncbi:hypothetical protein DMENIID0001_144440 [Sergentomyia squamirostris]
MKFLIVLAIIAVTGCQAFSVGKPSVRSVRSLDQHFVDFHKLLPLAEIQRVVVEYLGKDQEVQAVAAYLQSKDFSDLYVKVFTVKELKDVLSFLEKNGVDAYKYINHAGGFLHLPVIHPMIRLMERHRQGVESLLSDVLALLSKDKFIALYEDKYQNAQDFKAFVDALQGKEFEALATKLHQSKDYLEVLKTLKEHHLDLVKFVEIISKYFSS